MSTASSPVDGARVLSDLNALRAIGAYKTGVHKPTFSDAHLRSLEWLTERLPAAGLTGSTAAIGRGSPATILKRFWLRMLQT